MFFDHDGYIPKRGRGLGSVGPGRKFEEHTFEASSVLFYVRIFLTFFIFGVVGRLDWKSTTHAWQIHED